MHVLVPFSAEVEKLDGQMREACLTDAGQTRALELRIGNELEVRRVMDRLTDSDPSIKRDAEIFSFDRIIAMKIGYALY